MSIIRIQFKMSLSKVKAELEELSRRLINLRNNQIPLESDQISRQIRKTDPASLRETVLNDDIFSLYVAEVAQSLPECPVPRVRTER
jgi:hypothetical protein